VHVSYEDRHLALIAANPPKAALRARIEKANKTLAEGKFVHTIDPPSNVGYQPKRKTAKRRPR
jgi:hypothetical protein